MGAWGHGLLQNDSAQDGLVEVVQAVEDEIGSLADRRPDDTAAARLGAGVGLLLQLSASYSFEPKNPGSATVLRAIERQGPKLASLPPAARRLLSDVAGGKGPDLAARPARLGASLRRSLFATPSDDFPMERVFGKREPSLFAHPQAARYVQKVANWCVARVDEDFAEEDVVGDLVRESDCMGAFATLLVLEPCRVPVKKVERWRKAYERAVAKLDAEREAEGAPAEPDGEREFERDYGRCLDLAFRLMIKRFSK